MPDASTTNRQLMDKLDLILSQTNDLRVELRERLAILENQMENNQKLNEHKFEVMEKRQNKAEKIAYGALTTFIGILIAAFMSSIGVNW